MVGWGARTGSHALLREEAAVGLIGLARPAVGPGAPEEEKKKGTSGRCAIFRNCIWGASSQTVTVPPPSSSTVFNFSTALSVPGGLGELQIQKLKAGTDVLAHRGLVSR
jgi:hypothetical protein